MVTPDSEAPPVQRYDQQAEAAVIGAFFVEDGRSQEVFDSLRLLGLESDHFWYEDYQVCFDAISRLIDKSETVSLVAVQAELSAMGKYDDSMLETLTWTATNTFTSVGVETLAKIVIEHARFRDFSNTVAQIVNNTNREHDYKEAFQFAQNRLTELVDPTDFGIRHMSDIHWEKKDGVGWGIPTLDNFTYGIVPGELTIVAGSTGDGKSMLAGEVARYVANNQHRVLIFTLEMTAEEWKMRNLHAQAHVPMRTSRHDPPYSEEELDALDKAEALYDSLDLFVIDKANITPEQVSSTVKLMPGDSGVRLVIIDYLQLLKMHTTGTEEQAISNTTRLFKQLAGEANTHILLISQFNKQANYMPGEKTKCLYNSETFYNVPDHAHLKGSSAIAQDADRIVLLQRHPFNDDDANLEWWHRCSGHIEVFLSKQRNGQTGHGTLVRQFWEGRFRTFSKEELATMNGGLAIPKAWLRDQGYD